MGFNLKERRLVTRTIDVEFDGQSIEVKYRPYTFSGKWFKELEAKVTAEGLNYGAAFISSCLSGWDVTNGDADFPPTYDNLMEIPGRLLDAITEAIGEDSKKLEKPSQTAT